MKRIRICYNPYLENNRLQADVDGELPDEDEVLYVGERNEIDDFIDEEFYEKLESQQRSDLLIEFHGLRADYERYIEAAIKEAKPSYEITSEFKYDITEAALPAIKKMIDFIGSYSDIATNYDVKSTLEKLVNYYNNIISFDKNDFPKILENLNRHISDIKDILNDYISSTDSEYRAYKDQLDKYYDDKAEAVRKAKLKGDEIIATVKMKQNKEINDITASTKLKVSSLRKELDVELKKARSNCHTSCINEINSYMEREIPRGNNNALEAALKLIQLNEFAIFKRDYSKLPKDEIIRKFKRVMSNINTIDETDCEGLKKIKRKYESLEEMQLDNINQAFEYEIDRVNTQSEAEIEKANQYIEEAKQDSERLEIEAKQKFDDPPQLNATIKSGIKNAESILSFIDNETLLSVNYRLRYQEVMI